MQMQKVRVIMDATGIKRLEPAGSLMMVKPHTSYAALVSDPMKHPLSWKKPVDQRPSVYLGDLPVVVDPLAASRTVTEEREPHQVTLNIGSQA